MLYFCTFKAMYWEAKLNCAWFVSIYACCAAIYCLTALSE